MRKAASFSTNGRMSISSTSSLTSLSEQDAVLRQKLAPFMARPAPNRKLTIELVPSLSTKMQPVLKTVLSLQNGRFALRISSPYPPMCVRVTASDELSLVEPILDIDEEGVSVISDIDDTIKHTGIAGEKREVFRNVFIRNYDKISIEGVANWYNQLHGRGVKFHYVSNSPSQLYSCISEYLQTMGFPKGSIHLKQYSGILNGLFEPSSEKKKSILYSILKDFPKRKFIMVGDSGEMDLEAYCDLALAFPDQILAIYIRDVTLPADDKTLLVDTRKKAVVSYDSEHQSYMASRSMNDNKLFQPDLIDLGLDPPLPPRPKKTAPAVPRKPVGLRSPSTKIVLDADKSENDRDMPPPLPRRPANDNRTSRSGTMRAYNNHEPIIMSSTQNDYGEYEVLDKRVENWRARVIRAKSELPENVQLKMWRKGQDIDRESLAMCDEWLRHNHHI